MPEATRDSGGCDRRRVAARGNSDEHQETTGAQQAGGVHLTSSQGVVVHRRNRMSAWPDMIRAGLRGAVGCREGRTRWYGCFCGGTKVRPAEPSWQAIVK